MGIREDLEAMDDYYANQEGSVKPGCVQHDCDECQGKVKPETFISDVTKFAEICGHTTDQFNVRQTALYLGLQCEEFAEKLEEIFPTSKYQIMGLRAMAEDFKKGDYDYLLSRTDLSKQSLLDADVDLAWVTIGSMLSQGADVLGAIGEVTRANMDKFPGGVVTKDGNGKVKKPDGWKGPDLSEFVCK